MSYERHGGMALVSGVRAGEYSLFQWMGGEGDIYLVH